MATVDRVTTSERGLFAGVDADDVVEIDRDQGAGPGRFRVLEYDDDLLADEPAVRLRGVLTGVNLFVGVESRKAYTYNCPSGLLGRVSRVEPAGERYRLE